MSNFIGLVYATLKNEGVDTSGMSTDEAVAKFKELQKKSGGDTGKEGTPAEQRKLEEKGVVKSKKYPNIDEGSEILKEYKDDGGMNVVFKARNGKIFNLYNAENKGSPLVGPYSSVEEAQEFLMKHRAGSKPLGENTSINKAEEEKFVDKYFDKGQLEIVSKMKTEFVEKHRDYYKKLNEQLNDPFSARIVKLYEDELKRRK